MSYPDIAEVHRFTCRLDFEPAGLERLFQVVRRRGFVIERVNAEHDAEGLHVDLTVSGDRSPEMLRAHIEKMHTVRLVQRPLDPCFVADEMPA
ncbi:MAG: ACT domain-containing protein [Salinisphaera sp.]|uniref:ACT domain-containing protein n=1 Tax=Salinisphaera sp. TaxID=1914330 RepID=UPI003C7ADB77